jgi:hypothetical protein
MAHVIGIGTLWARNGLVNNNLVYTGVNAKRVWTVDWGCVGSPPVEKDGGAGTRGGHWDEQCMDKELMTGFVEGKPPMPISRLTLASIEDMGYTVNYGAADAYDGLNTQCCKSGGLSIQDDTSNGPSLSEEGRAKATAYGEQLLGENALVGISEELPEDLIYVGDKIVSVLYEEAGQIFEVNVGNDETTTPWG